MTVIRQHIASQQPFGVYPGPFPFSKLLQEPCFNGLQEQETSIFPGRAEHPVKTLSRLVGVHIIFRVLSITTEKQVLVNVLAVCSGTSAESTNLFQKLFLLLKMKRVHSTSKVVLHLVPILELCKQVVLNMFGTVKNVGHA